MVEYFLGDLAPLFKMPDWVANLSVFHLYGNPIDGTTPWTPAVSMVLVFLVGFAAETDNVIRHALAKLRNKNLDLVVANDVSRNDAGFDTSTNVISIIARDSEEPLELPIMSKHDAAQRILDEVVRLRRQGTNRPFAASPSTQSA